MSGLSGPVEHGGNLYAPFRGTTSRRLRVVVVVSPERSFHLLGGAAFALQARFPVGQAEPAVVTADSPVRVDCTREFDMMVRGDSDPLPCCSDGAWGRPWRYPFRSRNRSANAGRLRC